MHPTKLELFAQLFCRDYCNPVVEILSQVLLLMCMPQPLVIFLLQQSPLSVLPPSPCHVCQVFSALIRYQRISFTNHWHSLMSEIKQGSCSVMCNSRKYMYINFRIGNEQNDVYLKRVMCFPWQKVINKKKKKKNWNQHQKQMLSCRVFFCFLFFFVV